MDRIHIIDTIFSNGKMKHFALSYDWYVEHDIVDIYNGILENTIFLDTINPTLRERIFYIEHNLHTVKTCQFCHNNVCRLNQCKLQFKPTCGDRTCVKKLQSLNSNRYWSNTHPEKLKIRAEKIHNASLGRTASPETIEKLKIAHTGIKQNNKTITKRIETRKNNNLPWHTPESKLKISISNKNTHNSSEFKDKRDLLYKNSYEKISISMKRKILSGEFTPCITNSWTHWKSQIILEDGTIKKFRSSWEACFWLHNKHLKYEKIRLPYIDERGNDRIYIVDFYDEINNYLYEIKPKSLVYNLNNTLKEKAATLFCKEHGFTYCIIDEDWFKTNLNIDNMIGNEHLLEKIKKII